jgi:hypothetical protein
VSKERQTTAGGSNKKERRTGEVKVGQMKDVKQKRKISSSDRWNETFLNTMRQSVLQPSEVQTTKCITQGIAFIHVTVHSIIIIIIIILTLLRDATNRKVAGSIPDGFTGIFQ